MPTSPKLKPHTHDLPKQSIQTSCLISPPTTINAATVSTQLTTFKYSNRVLLKTILERRDGGLELAGESVVVGGWVKSSKEVRKEPVPLIVGDHGPDEPEPRSGVSCVEILQSRIPFLRAIVKVLGGSGGHYPLREKLEAAVHKPPPPSTVFLKVSDGSCVALFSQSLVHGTNVIELRVDKVHHIGTVDYSKYSLAKKRVPLDKLRDFCHIRARTTTVASVMRIRNALDFAAHTFCQNHGFLSVQVPILTTTDCKGFSEKFQDAINCADDFLKFLCKWVLENCPEDMKFVSQRIDKTRADHLHSVISSSFERISYTEALDAIKKVTEKKIDTKIEWGAALTEADLSYLADEIYKKPVIIYDYPKEAKPFYVRLNDDGKTVAAFDIVVPKAGKLISGSQNEERITILTTRVTELGLAREQYEWYLDLRRHGTVKHSGFSLEFDLMVLFSTGLTDVRDVIPFPRSYGKANY
ncbi:asparagine--tRNA ligase cytoplasmic 2 [Prunus yedoensis var. nudiflora]|uniref:Asparagine--tRNA ligase cytoplasmic 2 n=1 Tax=Prunus yedoensis var. nudiflora TaxID=2094558 RepID=A0A314Z9L9_PRUYE|nr:asparagine--tRNA ligase cytoplasmic 2 [Prunus yedoensis var. nudiflora]